MWSIITHSLTNLKCLTLSCHYWIIGQVQVDDTDIADSADNADIADNADDDNVDYDDADNDAADLTDDVDIADDADIDVNCENCHFSEDSTKIRFMIILDSWDVQVVTALDIRDSFLIILWYVTIMCSLLYRIYSAASLSSSSQDLIFISRNVTARASDILFNIFIVTEFLMIL